MAAAMRHSLFAIRHKPMRAKFLAFLRLSRPLFLLGGVVLYALGAMVARYEGYPLDLGLYLLGQVFVTGLQLMTHYLNEYWDVEADRRNPDRTPFSGGSGVLPEGVISRETARAAAFVCLAVASATAIVLALQYRVGPAAWVVMALAFLGAFFYSTPPLRLAHTGYGEMTTSIVVAGLVPAFAHLLQTGRASLMILFATAPLVVLHYAMLLAFEYPDFLADEAAGKRTLLVRLGRRSGAMVHNALIVIALGLAAANSFIGLPARVAISLAITAPLALWQVITMRRLQQGEPVSFSLLTFGAVMLFGVTAYLIAFSFWVIG
jgi:1,4-dihydroxy-2-naphthoate octaprenyltransferase